MLSIKLKLATNYVFGVKIVKYLYQVHNPSNMFVFILLDMVWGFNYTLDIHHMNPIPLRSQWRVHTIVEITNQGRCYARIDTKLDMGVWHVPRNV